MELDRIGNITARMMTVKLSKGGSGEVRARGGGARERRRRETRRSGRWENGVPRRHRGVFTPAARRFSTLPLPRLCSN
jgi:hypothetical protein